MKFQAQFFFTLIALILFSGCTDNKVSITLNIVDEISNLETQDVFLLNQYGDALNIDNLKSTNEFIIKVTNLVTGYYTLTFGEERFNLYLTPSTDIRINLDKDKVKYFGKDAELNDYLQRKYSPEFDWYTNYYKTKQTGDKMIYFRDHYVKILKQELEILTTNSQFVQEQRKELDYEYFDQLLLNKVMLETKPDTDEAIIKDLNMALSTDINDSYRLNNSTNFISMVARILVAQNRVDDLKKYYSSINHPNFKTYFLESLVSALSKELQFAEGDFNKAEIIESFITEQQPLDSIGHHIFNIYDKYREAKGKITSFSYEDVNGELVSLESLRGKYVYVDFWATWCVNCIKEFPYLKNLEKQFRNKEIEFVGISIDNLEAREKWKKMLIQKELHNIQLLAPSQGYPEKDDIEDDFMKLVYVNSYYIGIPHYVLIDPKGIIVNAFFYRPSNPKTEEYISELFNQL